VKEARAIADGTGFDDALLGFPGFVVTAVTENGDELRVGIEAILPRVIVPMVCASCSATGLLARC
jgi:hypothetical protein